MEQLSSRKNSKPKITQYKAMIQELLQQIKKISAENQSLKKELIMVRSNATQNLQKINKLQQMKDKGQIKIKNIQQQSANDKLRLNLQLTQKNNQIGNLRQENKMLKDRSKLLEDQKNNYLNQLSMLKKELSCLTQKLQKINDQKRIILNEKQEKDKYHQLQVQQLRKINTIIKKNFQTIQKDYESLLKLNQQQPPSFTIQRQPTKSQRTISKTTKNMALNIRNSYNPQMQEQLRKIKQQVSQQIVRISDNRQKVVKGRVDRTLASIQSILSTMSNRVNSQDQQSDQQ